VAKGDLVFIGPPGSGKGTQAQNLVQRNGWVQLSTGDLFRSHIAKGTALGVNAKRYIDKGEYVPDDLTVDMVRQRLREIPPTTRLVFDGFPRTVAQADALERLLAEFGRAVDGVISLDVPRNELLGRLVRRGKEQGRSDDTPEVISKRLDVYEQQTKPVLDHYTRLGLVRRVDGVGSVEEIAKRLSNAAEA
jgi:adenylate kinase